MSWCFHGWCCWISCWQYFHIVYPLRPFLYKHFIDIYIFLNKPLVIFALRVIFSLFLIFQFIFVFLPGISDSKRCTVILLLWNITKFASKAALLQCKPTVRRTQPNPGLTRNDFSRFARGRRHLAIVYRELKRILKGGSLCSVFSFAIRMKLRQSVECDALIEVQQ